MSFLLFVLPLANWGTLSSPSPGLKLLVVGMSRARGLAWPRWLGLVTVAGCLLLFKALAVKLCLFGSMDLWLAVATLLKMLMPCSFKLILSSNFWPLALHPQVLMGDWNCEPLQNSVLAALQRREARHLMAVDDDSVPLPTRWEGRRAIDYVVMHEACVAHRLRFHDLRYNDHKMICGRFQVAQLAHHTDWRLCGLARCSPPQGFCCNRWSSLLADGWNASAQLPSLDNLTVETCDACWAVAMAKLEEAFKYAWLVAREEIDPSRHHRLPKGRRKRSEPCFQAKSRVLRRPEGEQATNRLRCLRVLLKRLLALREHFVKDTLDSVEARNLVSKIQRCPYLPATQRHTARIQAVKSLIADAEKQQQDDKIRCWKNKLKASYLFPAVPVHPGVCVRQFL